MSKLELEKHNLLQVPSMEEDEEREVGVVKKVINHRFNTKTGEWSLNIMFEDGQTEWVVDSRCTSWPWGCQSQVITITY
jgi:hypothetical protein